MHIRKIISNFRWPLPRERLMVKTYLSDEVYYPHRSDYRWSKWVEKLCLIETKPFWVAYLWRWCYFSRSTQSVFFSSAKVILLCPSINSIEWIFFFCLNFTSWMCRNPKLKLRKSIEKIEYKMYLCSIEARSGCWWNAHEAHRNLLDWGYSCRKGWWVHGFKWMSPIM